MLLDWINILTNLTDPINKKACQVNIILLSNIENKL
jgi:hypothetical protein